MSLHHGTGKWVARMQRDGKTVTIGYYDKLEDAARARRLAVWKKYGAPGDAPEDDKTPPAE